MTDTMDTAPCPKCGCPPVEPVEVQYDGEPTILRCLNGHEYPSEQA